MKIRTAIQRRIDLPARLAICVAKQAAVSKSVQIKPLKMMTIHLSRANLAQRQVLPPRNLSSSFKRKSTNSLINLRPKLKRTSDEEQSHLQFMAVSELSESHVQVSLKQSKGKLRDLDLRKVVLLDNQSTIPLFCNKQLVKNIRKAKKLMTLKSNGGSMSKR